MITHDNAFMTHRKALEHIKTHARRPPLARRSRAPRQASRRRSSPAGTRLEAKLLGAAAGLAGPLHAPLGCNDLKELFKVLGRVRLGHEQGSCRDDVGAQRATAKGLASAKEAGWVELAREARLICHLLRQYKNNVDGRAHSSGVLE